MTPTDLINSVPTATNTDEMCNWFAKVQKYAVEAKNNIIENTATAGLFFSDNADKIIKFRRIALAQLKAI